jgi:hypothetical protein
MKRVTSRWLPRLAGLTAAVSLALSGFAGVARCETPKVMSCCEGAPMSAGHDCCSTSLCAPKASSPALAQDATPVVLARPAGIDTLWTHDLTTAPAPSPIASASPHAPPTILRI